MKRIIALTILLTSTICSAQIPYYGVDASTSLSSKVTLSNLLIYSEQINQASGYTAITLSSITANTTAAPDGTVTAETITASAGAGAHRVTSTSGTNRPAVAAGNQHRLSAYFKAGTHRYVSLSENGDSVIHSVSVDLQTCTTGHSQNVTASSAVSVGSGWCKVSIEFTHISEVFLTLAADTYHLTSSSVASGQSWTATGSETYYLWGMSLQLVSSPADYLQTTTAAATFGPTCGQGTSQSLIDPTRCFAVNDYRTRKW